MLGLQAWEVSQVALEIAMRRWERQSGYIQVCNKVSRQSGTPKIMLTKETRYQVKEFSTLLCIGMCKGLELFISFICISVFSGARILSFWFLIFFPIPKPLSAITVGRGNICWLQAFYSLLGALIYIWKLKSLMALTSLLVDIAGDIAFHKVKIVIWGEVCHL